MSAAVAELPIAETEPSRYLHGPISDFLMLGGGSLIALTLIWAVTPKESKEITLVITLAFAHVINNPHFANSYQIFYRDFWRKLTSYPSGLRWRYLLAGVIIPIILAGFFTSVIILQSPRILGVGTNLMLFFVGWHYVKQGYGMAMVDAVFKRSFYSDPEKKTLVWNSYALWIFSWCLFNNIFAGTETRYFGISYFAIPVPTLVVALMAGASALTTVRVVTMVRNRLSNQKRIAWNGLIAYAVSLYAWLLIRDPIVLLWIPLFHSLQYLAVVWRFEYNRSSALESSIRPTIRFALFIALGLGLGYLCFWVVPNILDAKVTYSKELFGNALFLFVFWIFINVHHYFLDSVMWRKGNPDVQEHLFAH
jgi:hypothetical protein